MVEGKGGGKTLEEAGWRQGALLPLLSFSVDFDRNNPGTPISESSLKAGAAAEVKAPAGIPPHAVASGLPSSKIENRWLVIISQTCDIAKPATVEPCVLACYAFSTEKERIIEPAGRDSAIHFVLNPESGLVVDCRTVVVIEKPLLETLHAQDSGASAQQLRRFARWLAYRYSRPAHPDSFVASVGHTIRDLLREIRTGETSLSPILKEIKQLRINAPNESAAFDIHLFIVLDDKYTDSVPEDLQLGLAELASRIESVLKNVSRFQWSAVTLEQMSARTWLDTDPLFLEDLTYPPAGAGGATPP